MYAELIDWLKLSARLSRHRRVLVLAGSRGWQLSLVKAISQDIYLASLWVGDKVDFMPSVLYIKAKQPRGQEKDCVVFETSDDLHVDALAACSGMIKGGGVLILLLPGKENIRAPGLFMQLFLKKLYQFSAAVIIEENNTAPEFPEPAASTDRQSNMAYAYGCMTADQADAVTVIVDNYQQQKLPIVLQANRGRGKSAALGIAAAELIMAGCSRVVVTAPSRKTTEVIFRHAEARLADIEKQDKKTPGDRGRIYFYAPDEIIREDIKGDVLLVDEAAAIPVPMLTALLARFKPCIYTTTVHGYEGTGRGFQLRFKSVLDKTTPGWQQQTLTTPIRWAEDDPLERWLFDLLFLDADLRAVSATNDSPVCEFSKLSQQQLADDEELLKEIFALLVIAHYRTRPSDLKQLLEDKNLSIYIARYKGQVIAVSLLAHEGGFDTALSQAVYRGERRPQGHMLAQALTYHCGIDDAASENYARIMRIAVHPQLQGKGIGSAMLAFIIQQEQQTGVSAIGTSFGLNSDLLRFWQRAGFEVVRVGFKREKTSGEHAAVMLQALNTTGQQIFSSARTRFLLQAPYWFDDILSDLPAELQSQLVDEPNPVNKTDIDWQKDIDAFVHYSRNFELCIAALHQWVTQQLQTIYADALPEQFRSILQLKVIDGLSWKAVVEKMQLQGQKQARQLFQQAVGCLLQENLTIE